MEKKFHNIGLSKVNVPIHMYVGVPVQKMWFILSSQKVIVFEVRIGPVALSCKP